MPKLAIVALSILVALTVVAAAAATKPVTENLSVTRSDSINCRGYKANSVRTFTGTVTTYFDEAGSPVRVQIHASMEGSLTNSKTGKSVGLRGHILVVIDLVSGTEAWNGQVIMADGAVIQDTGRIVFDAEGNILLEGGPHDAIHEGADVFCAAVA